LQERAPLKEGQKIHRKMVPTMAVTSVTRLAPFLGCAAPVPGGDRNSAAARP
jgi:hypothetical protein